MLRRLARHARPLSSVLATLLVAPAAAAQEAASTSSPPSAEPEEVRVVGAKDAQTGGSVHTVSDKQLKRFGYDDPHQVFLGVPGVYVRGEDGMGLRPNIGMRGANSDRSKKITLMEDGVLFGPAPYSAPAAYYFPLIGRMRSVRVLKGPSSVIYGPQTVGGAIDLLTRDVPQGRSGFAELAFGQYAFRKLSAGVGAGDERGGFWFDGEHLANDGFKTIDGDPQANTGFSRTEVMTKAERVVDPEAAVRQTFAIKLGYSTERSNETYVGLTDADFRADAYRRYAASAMDRMSWYRTQVQVSHKVEFSKNFDLTTTVYRHDLDRSWRKLNRTDQVGVADVLSDPTSTRNRQLYGVLTGAVDSQGTSDTLYIGPNDRTFVSQGIQTNFRWKVKQGSVQHQFLYGLRLHHDSIDRRHTEDAFLMRGGKLVATAAPTLTTADNRDATDAASGFVQDTLTVGRLVLTPGVRVEAIHGRREDRLTGVTSGGRSVTAIPGVGGYFAVVREKKQELGAVLGAHRGFSPAPPSTTGVTTPETSWNFEAGARYTRRAFRAEILGFYNAYQNLTSLCGFSSGCTGGTVDRQFDAGKARVFGVEAFADASWKLGRALAVPARLSYTYTRTEFLEDFASGDPQFGRVFAGYEMPYIPRHQLSGNVGLEHRRFAVNVAGTYVDKTREIAGDGPLEPSLTTDAYFLLDASAKLILSEHWELSLNARNLLDETYIASRRPFGARPGAPRWMQAGVRATF